MSNKLTTEEFVNRVKNKHPLIDVLGEYISAKTPIEFHCNVHDLDYVSTPDNFKKSKYGCPVCAREQVTIQNRKTHDAFVRQVNDSGVDVTIIGKYKTAKDPVQVQCNKCGYIYMALPDSLLSGCGCKPCAMKYVQNLKIKSHGQFLSDIDKYNLNSGTFEVISNYIKDEEPITCRCLVCDNVWTTTAHSLIDKRHATACPSCSMSKGEAKIRNYLRSINEPFIAQMVFDGLVGFSGKPLRYDFYLTNRNLLIEYQGEFHDNSVPYQTQEEYELQKTYDSRKKEYAKNHNIELFEIWYLDFDNIEQILETKLNYNKQIA